MSSCNIYKLRKINRALFDQLESNSVLLETRLKKLKENTRNSQELLQRCQSREKQRRRSWKMRNSSGEVLEVLCPEHPGHSSSSSGSELQHGYDKTVPSPSTESNNKQSKTSLERAPTNCLESSGDDIAEGNNMLNERTLNARISTDSVENVSLLKHQASDIQARNSYIPDGNAYGYTPNSSVLQILKERSQESISQSKNMPIKSHKCSSSALIKSKARRKAVISAEEKHVRSPMKETLVANSVPSRCHGCTNLSCDGECCIGSNTRENVPSKQKKDRKHLRKKRVCYRRSCHCRSASGSKTKKENVPFTAYEACTSANASSYSSRRCCPHTCPHFAPSKPDDHICSTRTQEESSSSNCTCQERGSWFNTLRKFRNSHWFDCHAKPTNLCSSPDEHKILKDHCTCYQKQLHTCVHQYAVNDRLFMQPVLADHMGGSRCLYCDVPRSTERASGPCREEQVLVSLPLRMLSSETSHQQSNIRQKRSPPPANSLALRYQKGML